MGCCRRDVPDDQINQGRPVDVVAKSSVLENRSAVVSDESVIGISERRHRTKRSSVIFGLGEEQRLACLSFSRHVLPNVVEVPDRGEAEATRRKLRGFLQCPLLERLERERVRLERVARLTGLRRGGV